MLNTLLAYNNYVAQRNASPASHVVNKAHLREAMRYLMMILVIDLIMLVWALYLASKCSGKDKLLHYVLAFFFPLFYIIYAYASGCAYSKSSKSSKSSK